MRRLTAGGVGLYYVFRPGPRPIVMLHGLATSLAFWYVSVLPLLKDGEFGVLLMDLRGHGQSDMPPTGYTTADMASDLHSLMEHVGLEQAHLVGHSYGAAVALHYAALHPDRVRSLVLADTRIRALQPRLRLRDWPNQPRVRDSLRRLGVPEGPDMEVVLLERLAEDRDEVLTISGVREALATPGPGVFSPFLASKGRAQTARQWLTLLRSTTAREDFQRDSGLTVRRIRRVNHPVLAVFGEHSPCLRSCRALARVLPNCDVVIVPRAGHFHPVGRPRFFAEVLRRFIGTVSSRA